MAIPLKKIIVYIIVFKFQQNILTINHIFFFENIDFNKLFCYNILEVYMKKKTTKIITICLLIIMVAAFICGLIYM